MASSRPRRSTAAQSFEISFPNISDVEDDDDGSDEAEAGAADGHGEQSAADGAAVAIDVDEDIEQAESTSGSEYAPEAAKGKDGKAIEVESEDSAEFEDDVPDDEDDRASGAGDADLDDASDIIPVGSDQPGPSQGLKHGIGRRGQAFAFQDTVNISLPTTENADIRTPAIRVVGRTPAAVLASTSGAQKKSVNKRRPLNSQTLSLKKSPAYDLAYGNCLTLPSFTLTQPFESAVHFYNGQQQTSAPVQAELPTEAAERLRLRRESYLVCGPHWSVVQDLGWHKDKFYFQTSDKDSVMRRSPRWGGWYSHVPLVLETFDVVQDIDTILPFLPRNQYPAAPVRVQSLAADEIIPDLEDDESRSERARSEASPARPVTSAEVGSSTDSLDDIASFSIGLYGEMVATDTIPVDSVVNGQQSAKLPRFDSMRLDAYLPQKPGWVFNCGAPIYGIDWCPQADDIEPAQFEYMAISTMNEQPSIQYRQQNEMRGGLIQLWSIDARISADFAVVSDLQQQGRGPRLELALMVESEVIQLAWCPKGGETEIKSQASAEDNSAIGTPVKRLGILAALSANGTVRLYDVPHPESIKAASSTAVDDLLFLRQNHPLLTLSTGIMAASCFDWMSHTRLAVGFQSGKPMAWSIQEGQLTLMTPGEVIIFDIDEALSIGAQSVAPTQIVPVHETPIRMICTIREPILSSTGTSRLDQDPARLATASLDGAIKTTDLQDPGTLSNYGHERAIRTIARYQPSSGGIIFNDQEMGIRFLGLRPRDLGASTRLMSVNGPATDVAVSDFHPFIAVASADGSCGVVNSTRRLKRGAHVHHLVNKVFKMDFNRRTGEYRMLDNIIPDARVNHESRITAQRAKRKKKNEAEEEEEEGLAPDMLPSGYWPPHVGVLKNAWCKSLRRAHVLASAMACGLVRIDMVHGYWPNDAPPTVQNRPKVELDDDSDD